MNRVQLMAKILSIVCDKEKFAEMEKIVTKEYYKTLQKTFVFDDIKDTDTQMIEVINVLRYMSDEGLERMLYLIDVSNWNFLIKK
jgi:acetolactate synthase small subunit